MRVLLAGGGTGGHLMPALALAQALRELRPDAEPVLVGAQRGIEGEVLPRHPFRYHLLAMEPIYRRAWWRNLRWPLVAARVWGAVGRVLAAERPAVVVGTGGYVAGPVLWRAGRQGIPTVLQEQNAFPGLTTRWLCRYAAPRQIHLGFPEARARLRVGRGTVVYMFGNPVALPRSGERSQAHALAELGLTVGRLTVLVFGGSQGASAINAALAGALAQDLLPQTNVLWGTGTAHYEALKRFETAGRVVIRGFFDPMASAYQAADLVVCRAGAVTVAELCAWGKPSVLVPLPSAAADHQTFNARALAAAGAAVLLREPDLTPRTLAECVRALVVDRTRLESLATAARGRGHPNASREIMSTILTLIG